MLCHTNLVSSIHVTERMRGMENTDGQVEFRCSFCAKLKEQVEQLIAGPHGSVYICNECVETCNELLREQKVDQLQRQSQEPHE